MNQHFKKIVLFVGLCAVIGLAGIPQTASAASNEMAAAPAHKVSGHVRDAMGPLVGATVMVKGSKGQGTVTNIDGNFTLDAPPAPPS